MSLKDKVISGAKWVTFANAARQVLQMSSLVVFARILSPSDFGLYAILMIFVGFLNMLADMGTSAALVYVKDPTRKFLSSIFFFNILVGGGLCLALTLSSPLVAAFFEETRLASLLPLISVQFVVTGFGMVHRALFTKQLAFKKISILESLSSFVGVTVGIVAAFNDWGVHSLIAQTLTNATILVVLVWRFSNWRPLWYFSVADIRRIWGYTANLSAFNILNYFARNADNFLIGKILGSPALGVYSLAYKLMLYPLQNISQVLVRVLFPAFARIRDDRPKFKASYVRVISFITLLSFPMMVGLWVTADILVAALFGEKWGDLAQILRILVPVGMMQSVVTTVGLIYTVTGDTRTMFRIGGTNAVITVAGFVLGVQFGLKGVAVSYLIVNGLMLLPNLIFAWRQIDLTVPEGFLAVAPALFMSLAMGIAATLTDFTIGDALGNDVARLVMVSTSGAAFYLACIHYKYGGVAKVLADLRG